MFSKVKKNTTEWTEVKVKQEELHNFYDCVINVDSLFSLITDSEWKISIKDWNQYLQHSRNGLRRIGVLGHENKGKSWILGKVMGYILPHGYHTHTRGLCMLYPPHVHIPMAALDTPGTNTPIRLRYKNEILKAHYQSSDKKPDGINRRLLADNILTETLLQSFVIEQSEVLLVVVGKLEISDQKLLGKLLKKKEIAKKKIIIVHNFMNSHHIEDVQKLIQSDILDCVEVSPMKIYSEEVHKKGKANDLAYLEEIEGPREKTFPVVHLVMAHEGSKAGDYYNRAAISYIRESIATYAHNTPFDVVEEFSKHFNSTKENYYSSNEEKDQLPKAQVITNDKGTPTEIKFSERLDAEIRLTVADEFGQIKILNNGTKEPDFSIKIMGNEDQQKYVQVEIEINGLVDIKDLKTYTRSYGDFFKGIEISGKILDPTNNDDAAQECKVLESSRTFGKFRVSSQPLDLGNYALNNAEQPKCQQKGGVLIITWKLVENWTAPKADLNLRSQASIYQA